LVEAVLALRLAEGTGNGYRRNQFRHRLRWPGGRLVLDMDETIAVRTGWTLACRYGRHRSQYGLVGWFTLGHNMVALEAVVSSKCGGGQAPWLVLVARVVVFVVGHTLILVAS
jgi:hypothetical protein